MASHLYNNLQISSDQASFLAQTYFGITGKATPLPGEIDFNFRIKTSAGTSFILKVSRPDMDLQYIDFQLKILLHLSKTNPELTVPKIILNKEGNPYTTFTDDFGQVRLVRMLTWIDGRLWSSVHPITEDLLYNLGKAAGEITKSLYVLHHPFAKRDFEWDIDQALWTEKFLHLFNTEEKQMVIHFLQRFTARKSHLAGIRKSIIHNDINDNNILVSQNPAHPDTISIIDFGDAIYTSTINDLAVCITYAVMEKPDPLQAASTMVKGYHEKFVLHDDELKVLHLLVAMRLIISVTKSARNKIDEPENKYLLISEKPAWTLLRQWINIDEHLAYYTFRHACGLVPHPDLEMFNTWANNHPFGIEALFPTTGIQQASHIDMSVGSTWLGHRIDFTDNDQMAYRIKEWSRAHPGTMVVNGYLETRPFYSTPTYQKEGNNGPKYRTVHLGVDFWIDGHTPLHAPLDGEVFSIFDNDQDKDYGPTIILSHTYGQQKTFYTLYGHLSKTTLETVNVGQTISKGQHIGYIGQGTENGNWSPHLHFQIILDMLGNTHDFPGVAFPSELDIWKSICPDPNIFLQQEVLYPKKQKQTNEIIRYRTDHLGKSLSLSYAEPLHIVRGEGSFLIDITGRRYLDTVNNVAHVGHEHPRIVKAGQAQMALLNTNTRYLHESINDFAEALLATLPPELCVVHFVNSGSEANELALRMAYNHTGQKDIIAIASGYHGNTNACIGVSSYKFDGKGGKGKPNETHIIPLPDMFRGRYRGPDSGPEYAAHVDTIIQQLGSQGKNVAGFIHESIISCGGQIVLPGGFLEKSYRSIRAAGGLCIADEVQTGCGRVGSHWWAFELHGVVPDIVTIGKPLGNGHPVAAVVCTRAVAESFANGMEFFNTFGGNPVSCVIGHEVIKVVREEGLMENAKKTGHEILTGLKILQQEFPIIGDVRGNGLFLGFELTDDNLLPLEKQTSYLANRMMNLGILMSTDGPNHNVLKIKPPMVFNKENTDELLSRLRQVFREDEMQVR
ncbi:MAG: aminotransferase class III-fold pyridoxal phosphate-dependent enzyme [Saprospiraceae bacterium]|nr:aminotransferase class III-fold pyridoxal phosphate-dependent enzyme [Saprospiraceae bacterium]